MARTKADRRSMEVRAQIHKMERRRRMEEATAEEAQGEASTPEAEMAAAKEPTSDGDSQTILALGGVAAEEAEAERAKAACSTYRSDEEEKW